MYPNDHLRTVLATLVDMFRYLAITCCLAAPLLSTAQSVAAFLDYMERLHVFDRGVFKQIEGQRPMSFKVGGNYVAYIDAREDLKVYHNGGTQRLDRTADIIPTVTDHFLGYRLASALKVFDGNLRTLSGNVGQYLVADSIAAFHDINQQTVNVYYRGRVEQIEDALAGEPIAQWKAGDNLIAWVSTNDRLFKVYYRGEVIELGDRVRDMDFQCGLDLVAYSDPYDRTFKVFNQGLIYDLEDIMPARYEVGKGVMAWLDMAGALKVFQGGRIYTAQNFEPQHWQVMDSLVVIQDQGFFKVFSDGVVHEVERVIPATWSASWATVAYVDVDQSIRVWRKGRSEMITRGENIRDLQLIRGVLVAKLGVSNVRIWWRGDVYNF